MLVGLSGFIGSGKDTVGKYVTEIHGFVSISFASTLKDIVSSIFGWDRKKLEGTTKEDREWREQVDTWWEHKLEIKGLTPRLVLQKIGTDLFRTHFHPDIWTIVVERKILSLLQENKHVVVTDCRFINEGELIHKLGGKVFRITRNNTNLDDRVYSIMHKASSGDLDAIKDCKEKHIHPSEYSILSFPFDGIIENNDSLDELYKNIDKQIL